MKTAIDKDAAMLKNEGLILDHSIIGFASFVNLTATLKQCGVKGACGYAAHMIFLTIFILPFVMGNIYSEVVINNARIVSKDAVYDFLKQTGANWRNFLIAISSTAIAFCNSLTNKGRERVIAIDDTPFKKDRSKSVELLSKCWDHCDAKHFKGFRLLNCVWTDGFSIIPICFSLLASILPSKRYHEATKNVDPRSNAAKRRLEAVQGAPKVVVLLSEIIFKIFRQFFDAVTFDSWFAINSIIFGISKYAPVVCMVKKNCQLMFKFSGVLGSIDAVYRNLKNRRRGQSQIIGSTIAELVYKHDGLVELLKCKIVFVRSKINGDWIPILSTNIKFDDEKIIRLYGLRWNIEVFHKDIKQFLSLERGSQSRDFDALTAYVTVVFVRYIYLALKQRLESDDRKMGIGTLFYACYHEIKQITSEDAMLRADKDACQMLLASKAACFTASGKCAFTIDQIQDAMAYAAQDSLSGIKNALQALLARQKDIDNLRTTFIARLKAVA